MAELKENRLSFHTSTLSLSPKPKEYVSHSAWGEDPCLRRSVRLQAHLLFSMLVFNVREHWWRRSPSAARHERASDCWITCDILGLLFSQLIRYLNQVSTSHTCSCGGVHSLATLCLWIQVTEECGGCARANTRRGGRLNSSHRVLHLTFLKTADQGGAMMCFQAVCSAADSEVRVTLLYGGKVLLGYLSYTLWNVSEHQSSSDKPKGFIGQSALSFFSRPTLIFQSHSFTLSYI